MRKPQPQKALLLRTLHQQGQGLQGLAHHSSFKFLPALKRGEKEADVIHFESVSIANKS
jgi:hypothetical protein